MLTRDELEQVRLHAHRRERVLDAAAGLRPLARFAGLHDELCSGRDDSPPGDSERVRRAMEHMR